MKNKPIELTESLAYLLTRSGKEMRRVLSANLCKTGMRYNSVHARTLMILYYHDGQNQQELADKLELDKTAMARLLSFLEEEGLVVRIEDKQDKRNKLVYMTNSGRNVRDEMIPVLIDTIGVIENKIDPDKLKVTKEVLAMIIDILCAEQEPECDEKL